MTREHDECEDELAREARLIPNHVHPSTPIGPEENAHVVRTFGKEPSGDQEKKTHLELMTALDLVDFESASKVSGSKFVYLKNEAARLEMALCAWATDRAVDAGFTPVSCPDIVRRSIVDGCGFVPRGDGEASQIYGVVGDDDNKGEDMSLVGTAEIPLAGMFADRTFQSLDELPSRLVGISHCFRTEAGAPGRDSKGLYRLHQFTKVELFACASSEQSDGVLEELCAFQQSLYEELGLRCRVLDMPTEELGASAYRKYDIEAWMPSRGGYGEISSASNCTDYQSRRLNIRVKSQSKKNEFVHTLNATAVAVPRVMLALLETCQDDDGRSVEIPSALRPYMGGHDRIPCWKRA